MSPAADVSVPAGQHPRRHRPGAARRRLRSGRRPRTGRGRRRVTEAHRPLPRDPHLRAPVPFADRSAGRRAARTALLHQLRCREATDTDRFFGYCLRRADHPDFFSRKAIGWALREYARTDPAAVRDFVDSARTRLSPLSAREALKNL